MKALLSWTISQLVDHPDKVVINEKSDGDFTIYSLSVAPEDMGMVIGKEGKIIKSLRQLLKIPALIQKKKVTLALMEQNSN